MGIYLSYLPNERGRRIWLEQDSSRKQDIGKAPHGVAFQISRILLLLQRVIFKDDEIGKFDDL
ncbi:hypothetical protein TW84_16035 [Vibrio neptunius]|nr:hypothetical protein TW84_16035 [Vibrio neptunius]